MIMKKVISISILLLSLMQVSAQTHFQVSTSPDILRHTGQIFPERINVVVPGVRGYNAYKAELHIHTIYSDGHVSPEYRVQEAWNDGLDILAITEHIEYRELEKNMIEFMGGYVKKDAEAVNWNIVGEPADKKGIQTDLNMSVRLAQKVADRYGITIIPGAEISREPSTTGHFNVLFTKDNNKIYDPDPIQSMMNAKAQGALVVHNHPGWRRPSMDMIDFEKKIYPMGMLDGIEVMNQLDFYPRAVDRADEYGLFVTSNTDLHYSSYEFYRLNGALRNMTIIFADDKSEESLKEALKARRSLAYSFGVLAGEESLLRDFFLASVSCEVMSVAPDGTKTIRLKNNSSLPYVVNYNGDPYQLRGMSELRATVKTDGPFVFTVENLWASSKPGLRIEINN